MSQTGGMASRARRAGRALAVLVFVVALAGGLLGAPALRASATPSQVSVGGSPRTAGSASSTAPVSTIAPLGNRLPVSPVTLPLRTRSTNAHVNPAFAYLSVAGFALALAIALGRMFMTRAGGPDRRPLPLEADRLE